MSSHEDPRLKSIELGLDAASQEMARVNAMMLNSKEDTSRAINYFLLVKSFPLIVLFPIVGEIDNAERFLPNELSVLFAGVIFLVIALVGAFFTMHVVRLRCETLLYARALNGGRAGICILIGQLQECGSLADHFVLPRDASLPRGQDEALGRVYTLPRHMAYFSGFYCGIAAVLLVALLLGLDVPGQGRGGMIAWGEPYAVVLGLGIWAGVAHVFAQRLMAACGGIIDEYEKMYRPTDAAEGR